MTTQTRINVPTKEQVDEKSQAIFDQLKSQLGMVPNLYATIGYSSDTLGSFLAFSGEAGKGSFNAKEIEAIKLAVSEANNCVYCKSAHTAIAKGAGFTEEETVALRKTTIEDGKLNTLTKLAREVSLNAGHVSDEVKERFFEVGYNEKALIDFVAVVISVTFTNYVHGLTKVAVDFPVVE